MQQRIAQTRRWLARLIMQPAHLVQVESALDAGPEADLPKATVLATEAMGKDAARGSDPVSDAGATAAATALESDARAVGVAMAARETGVRASGRAQQVAEILAAAADRDSRAELRDRVAEERERAASLCFFLGDEQDQAYEHSGGIPGRRAAALDRVDARADRACAASDRARLSAHPPPGSEDGEVSEQHILEVAAELSHDLRVPLSSIMASVELLEDELRGNSDPTVCALLMSAMRAGDRMVRMLDQHMAPHPPGNSTTMPEIDLAEIVRQLVVDSGDLLEPVGAVVEIGELPVVHADPDEMYSVLQNLITNSIKFARAGVPAIVRISARRSVDGWRVSVRDNGVGLPDSSGLDVFSLFSRGTSDVTGHGIGLATVARIVTTHGGRVGVAPVETGAEIWFDLLEDELVR